MLTCEKEIQQTCARWLFLENIILDAYLRTCIDTFVIADTPLTVRTAQRIKICLKKHRNKIQDFSA